MTDFQNQLAQQVQVLGGHAHSVDTGNALKVQKNQSTQALMMLNNLLEVHVYIYQWCLSVPLATFGKPWL